MTEIARPTAEFSARPVSRTGGTLLFIPMYNCQRQIGRVLAQLTPEVRSFLSEVILVDNRSTDNGRTAAITAIRSMGDDPPLPVRLMMNDGNYGLGGSHKVAFNHALMGGFDHVAVLHGDDQGHINDLMPHLRAGAHRLHDCLLGARFMHGSTLKGYSWPRTLGNHVFNLLYSLVARYRIRDLGAGLNIYAVRALADRGWMRNADDLTFNYHMILRSIADAWRMQFFPLSWREDDQISNVKLVRQSLRVAGIALSYFADRETWLARDHSDGHGNYRSTVIYDNEVRR